MKKILLLALFTLSGCLSDQYYTNTNSDPYYPDYRRPSEYDYYHGSRYEYDRAREQRREREALKEEREKLEDERKRLERERERIESRPPPAPAQEHCPRGFQPSERKCSTEERRRGCQDMRLPSGLGCVRR